ncbi:hypothetical protein [Nocardia abscessus]|uniref:hypothetical protein n=1 Tax=Nocardia abscessus TaxID=120957 RepID=UPI002458C32C|nr:hypothetical protein [Nocardia abscessus]
MVVNIRLRPRWELTSEEAASDSLHRRWAGYDPKVSAEELWRHNRGRWNLSEKRLDSEKFATFSVDGTIVAVYRIDNYERVADVRPGTEKIALIGRPLPETDPVHVALIGSPVPTSGRNPVRYLPDTFEEGIQYAPAVPRRAFLLTWNPGESDWDQYQDFILETAVGRPVPDQWSTGSRVGGVEAGDRVFMLRQGDLGRGIVASGTATSGVYEDEHWDSGGGYTNYIRVEWDAVVDVADRMPKEVLEQEIPEQHWTPQASGTAVKAEVVDELETLWSAHVGHLISPMRPRASTQGRVSDAERRRLIENAAQNRLMAHYRRLGWQVRDTRYAGPYDAVATKGAATLYLEAKGTQSTGEVVLVTHGEVVHARTNHGRCVMGIWSGITLDDTGRVDESSGSFEIIPFTPDSGTLIPLEYRWEHGGGV